MRINPEKNISQDMQCEYQFINNNFLKKCFFTFQESHFCERSGVHIFDFFSIFTFPPSYLFVTLLNLRYLKKGM